VIKNELGREVFANEFEVYLLKNHEKALALIDKYPNSILFINIDEVLDEKDWEEYIKGIMNNEKTKDVRIGILTYNEDKNLAKKYLMDIMIPCGFIRLKLGLDESINIILKTLEANEAKGKRKYIRVSVNEHSASFNIKISDTIYSGKILDISSVGMSCILNKDVKLELRSRIDDIQLRLTGTLCKLKGVVVGHRKCDTKECYVIMFNKNMDKETKNKMFFFIFHCLQEEMQKI
jgi:hypothetical protein